MSHLYQISMKSVLTLENGMKENVKGENLLSITLVYPREGIKSMESIKKLKLKSGETYSFKDISFSDKLLFKESIQGDSAIIISLTAIEKVAKIRGIIQDGIKAGVIAGVGLITGGAGITILTAVTKSVIGSLFDLAKPKDKLTVMGKIDFPINNQLEEGELVLNLTVPKKLSLKERKREDGQEILVTKTLEKGFGIAKVILDVKKIPKAEFVLHPVPQV
jgi:hypothetical protein